MLVGSGLRTALVVFALATVVAALAAAQLYSRSQLREEPMSWGAAFGWAALAWYYWAVAALGVLWLSRRLAVGYSVWTRVAVHAATASVAVLAHPLLYLAGVALLGLGAAPGTPGGRDAYIGLLGAWGVADVLAYALVFSLGHAAEAQRRLRDREVLAARLETQLADARLHALQAQLRPHFLFNALHGVAALARSGDSAEVVRMLARLAGLLRHVLEDGGRAEVPLSTELEFIERYLDVERMRFPDRLQAVVRAGPEVLGAMVPSLILQPLVENAVRHGITPRVAGGYLEITAQRSGDTLELCVRDDGEGLGPSWSLDSSPAPDGRGVGIANTRARLALLYGGAHDSAGRSRLEVASAPGGGVMAVVRIPFRRDTVASVALPLTHPTPVAVDV